MHHRPLRGAAAAAAAQAAFGKPLLEVLEPIASAWPGMGSKFSGGDPVSDPLLVSKFLSVQVEGPCLAFASCDSTVGSCCRGLRHGLAPTRLDAEIRLIRELGVAVV